MHRDCRPAVAAPQLWRIPVGVRLPHVTKYFMQTSQCLKKLDKATSGPLFSLYAESLNGVTSIRAFNLHAQFEKLLIERLDKNHRAHFLWTASSRWFALRLDWLTTGVILLVGICVLLFRNLLAPSLAALALTYILQISSLFQWGFRMWAECNNHFVSVERALGYTKVPQEAAAVNDGDAALITSAWPANGALKFTDVAMRYRPGLPLVLQGASFEIGGGVKAAVVGRSGAGKSSLSVALLRLAELDSGSISIDGVDLSSLGLTLLRKTITFIQQDAILFAGTIGSNPLSASIQDCSASKRLNRSTLRGYRLERGRRARGCRGRRQSVGRNTPARSIGQGVATQHKAAGHGRGDRKLRFRDGYGDPARRTDKVCGRDAADDCASARHDY